MTELNAAMKQRKLTYESIAYLLMIANMKAWYPEKKIQVNDAEQGDMMWHIIGLLCTAVTDGTIDLEGMSKFDGIDGDSTPCTLEQVKEKHAAMIPRLAEALTQSSKASYDYTEWFCGGVPAIGDAPAAD